MLKNFFEKKTPALAVAVAAGEDRRPNALPVPGVIPMFAMRETVLCAKLGVSKDELRRRRQYFLTEGQHWAYVGKRVLLSEVGAAILRGTAMEAIPAAVSQQDAAAVDAARNSARIAGLLLEKNPPPVEFAGELVVWGVPTRNARLVTAYIPGNDPNNPLHLVTVAVKENVNFLRGMRLPAARVNDSHFDLVGPCPRWRGKW